LVKREINDIPFREDNISELSPLFYVVKGDKLCSFKGKQYFRNVVKGDK
jgi:hypothetical protein